MKNSQGDLRFTIADFRFTKSGGGDKIKNQKSLIVDRKSKNSVFIARKVRSSSNADLRLTIADFRL
jgi:hypothetical protein